MSDECQRFDPFGPGMPAVTEADVTLHPRSSGTAGTGHAVACLRRVGVVLLRQAITEEAVDQALATVRSTYARLPEIMQSNPGTAQVLGELGLIAPDHVPHFPELAETACRLVRSSAAWPVLEDYFRATPLPDLDTLRYRHHRPFQALSAVPLHQDIMFTGTDRSKVNCWIPLTRCGRDAPGLEFYPMYHVARFVHRQKPMGGAYPMDSIRPAALSNFPSPLHPIEPEFAPGDMLLFDDFCLHRTTGRPGMTAERFSLDMRYTFAGTKGPQHDGLRHRPPV